MNAVAFVSESGILAHWTPHTSDVSAGHALGFTYPRQASERPFEVPLTYLESHGRRLSAAKPVKVTLEMAEGQATAVNELLHVYALGDNYVDALADFQSQIVELFDHYSSLAENNVIGEGARLRALFVENFAQR